MMIVSDFLKIISGNAAEGWTDYPHAKQLRLLLNKNAKQQVDTFCIFDEPTKQDCYVVFIFQDKETKTFRAVRSTGSYHYESIALSVAIKTIESISFKKNLAINSIMKRQMLLEDL